MIKISPFSVLLLAVVLTGAACNTSQAYTNYTGCSSCHGDFRGPTSTKGTVFPGGKNHEMHRAGTSMATACDLCHTGSSRTPVYIGFSNGTSNNRGIGCSGCHVGAELRAHHNANGVTECYDCHLPETSDPENVGYCMNFVAGYQQEWGIFEKRKTCLDVVVAGWRRWIGSESKRFAPDCASLRCAAPGSA